MFARSKHHAPHSSSSPEQSAEVGQTAMGRRSGRQDRLGNSGVLDLIRGQSTEGGVRTEEPAGVQVCNRKTTWGVGNHEYLWNNRDGRSCGLGSASDSSEVSEEAGPGVDACVDVTGSAGLEDTVMDYCRDNDGLLDLYGLFYLPGLNDCHTLADDALEQAGLDVVDLPRFGDPGRVKGNEGWESM